MNDDQSTNGSGTKSWLGRLGQALTGGEPRDRSELIETLREAHDRKLLDDDALSMIEGAMDVSETQVRDAMIPRGQMIVLNRDATPEEALAIIVESGHSRFPVVGEDKDEIDGILLAKDMLRLFVAGGEGLRLTDVLRSAVFIPESKRLNVLLKEFRASRNHMAIVVDEYGGVAGLITIEDVLEEIVGEIDDEHDEAEDAFIRAVDDNHYTVKALTPIDEFNEYFGTELSESEFDTIGGLVTGEIGRLPELGERVEVTGVEFEVLQADSRRLHLLGLSASIRELS